MRLRRIRAGFSFYHNLVTKSPLSNIQNSENKAYKRLDRDIPSVLIDRKKRDIQIQTCLYKCDYFSIFVLL